MGDLLLGGVRPDALYVGADPVSKVYWGSHQVWPYVAPPAAWRYLVNPTQTSNGTTPGNGVTYHTGRSPDRLYFADQDADGGALPDLTQINRQWLVDNGEGWTTVLTQTASTTLGIYYDLPPDWDANAVGRVCTFTPDPTMSQVVLSWLPVFYTPMDDVAAPSHLGANVRAESPIGTHQWSTSASFLYQRRLVGTNYMGMEHSSRYVWMSWLASQDPLGGEFPAEVTVFGMVQQASQSNSSASIMIPGRWNANQDRQHLDIIGTNRDQFTVTARASVGADGGVVESVGNLDQATAVVVRVKDGTITVDNSRGPRTTFAIDSPWYDPAYDPQVGAPLSWSGTGETADYEQGEGSATQRTQQISAHQGVVYRWLTDAEVENYLTHYENNQLPDPVRVASSPQVGEFSVSGAQITFHPDDPWLDRVGATKTAFFDDGYSIDIQRGSDGALMARAEVVTAASPTVTFAYDLETPITSAVAIGETIRLVRSKIDRTPINAVATSAWGRIASQFPAYPAAGVTADGLTGAPSDPIGKLESNARAPSRVGHTIVVYSEDGDTGGGSHVLYRGEITADRRVDGVLPVSPSPVGSALDGWSGDVWVRIVAPLPQTILGLRYINENSSPGYKTQDGYFRLNAVGASLWSHKDLDGVRLTWPNPITTDGGSTRNGGDVDALMVVVHSPTAGDLVVPTHRRNQTDSDYTTWVHGNLPYDDASGTIPHLEECTVDLIGCPYTGKNIFLANWDAGTTPAEAAGGAVIQSTSDLRVANTDREGWWTRENLAGVTGLRFTWTDHLGNETSKDCPNAYADIASNATPMSEATIGYWTIKSGGDIDFIAELVGSVTNHGVWLQITPLA